MVQYQIAVKPVMWIEMGLLIALMRLDVAYQEHVPFESGTGAHGESKEYCLATEAFEARCLKNEVIVMNSAIFGRMRIGRCLDAIDVSSFGSGPDVLGCSVDVLHIFDRRCSLKNQCEVVLALDNDLLKKKPCHQGLKSYLEAGFECVTVIESDRSCIVSASSSPLHLMHSSTTKHSCGTQHQPWVIEAPLGQNINVSLLDLNSEVQTSANEQRDNCHQYGYIIDRSTKRNISICGLAHERKKLIYKSSTNVIEVVLYSPINMGRNLNASKVLLGVIAIGCSHLVPPEDTWLTRNDNEIIVGCYSSRQTWALYCTESQWIGVIGNCTREVPVSNKISAVQRKTQINYQVMVMVAIGFLGLIICVMIIIVGVVCLKRYAAKLERGYCQQDAKNATVWRASSQPVQKTDVRSELLS